MCDPRKQRGYTANDKDLYFFSIFCANENSTVKLREVATISTTIKQRQSMLALDCELLRLYLLKGGNTTKTCEPPAVDRPTNMEIERWKL